MQVMRCTACASELILTSVVPDETAPVRGIEHHTFICSECHTTERRVVFIKDGRESDAPPMPMQTVRFFKPMSTEDEHVGAPGLFGRMMARLLGR